MSHAPFLIMSLFILPGLVHAAYMYFDIGSAIRNGLIPFVTSSKHGLLESVKDSLRVGRRYESVAMLHLLCGGLLMVCHYRVKPGSYWAWSLVGLSVLSLALLDARRILCPSHRWGADGGLGGADAGLVGVKEYSAGRPAV